MFYFRLLYILNYRNTFSVQLFFVMIIPTNTNKSSAFLYQFLSINIFKIWHFYKQHICKFSKDLFAMTKMLQWRKYANQRFTRLI